MENQTEKITNEDMLDRIETILKGVDTLYGAVGFMTGPAVNFGVSRAGFKVIAGLDEVRSGLMESVGVIRTYGGRIDDKGIPDDFATPF